MNYTNLKTIVLKLFPILIFACAGIVQAQTTTDLSTGVVGYYPFNGDTKNHSPNRINGTDAIVYGASESYDRHNDYNKAYTFDGRDDYIKIEQAIALDRFSISFWYNTTSTSKGTILFWEGGNFHLSISDSNKDNGKVAFSFGNEGDKKNQYISKSPTNEGQWHHFLLSFDGKQVSIYEDGNGVGKSGNMSKKKNLEIRIGDFYIGGYPSVGGSFFQGRLDEVLIYNRALTGEEAKVIFENGKIPFNRKLENGMIFHLPFSNTPFNQSPNVMKGLEGYVNGASLSFDRFGMVKEASHFDGIDDYISLKNNAKHPQLTTCFWMNTTSTSNSQVMGWGEDSGFRVMVNSKHHTGKLSFNLKVAGGDFYSFVSPKNVNDGNWHFVAFTYNGSTIRGYIDGRMIYQDSKAGGFREVIYGDNDLTIGKGGETFYQGRVDDVRIFNRALNSTEIGAIFNEDSRQSIAKINTAFQKDKTLQVDFTKSIKGKIELQICDSNGRQLEKKKHKISKNIFYYDLSKFNLDRFKVKIKVNGQWIEKEIAFCRKDLS